LPDQQHHDASPDAILQLAAFGFVPDKADPGWWRCKAESTGSFKDLFGAQQCRAESTSKARLRIHPRSEHANMVGILHGGFIMSVIDHSLFVGPAVLGIPRVLGGQTISICTDFLRPMRPQKPIDIVLEVMRDTYRMIFLRGTVEQDDCVCVSFSGKTRKPARDLSLQDLTAATS
jgi:acyl-coenzyme A thioesterase PaaI-like protein